MLNLRTAIWALFCMTAVSGLCGLAPITLKNGLDIAIIQPDTLLVTLSTATNRVCISAAQTNLGSATGLQSTLTNAQWQYPQHHIKVGAAWTNHTLEIHLTSDAVGSFSFPVIPKSTAWIIPMFEGAYVPCDDPIWMQFLEKQGPINTTADLTMPFFGAAYGSNTVTYIFENAFNNTITFSTNATFSHEFTRNHAVKEYGVRITLDDALPIAPARTYRAYLQGRGDFVTLAQKIQRTPEAAKLFGAAHIYLWGAETISITDVKDWKLLCQGLQSNVVWTNMQSSARDAVQQISKAQWPDRYTKSVVIEELNRLLEAKLWDGSENKLALAPKEEWGGGVSPQMIRELQKAGLDRLWLGSDGWDGFVKHPESVAIAKQTGYLIGPYDSYNSIHKPGAADTWEAAQFDQSLYDTGGVIRADGSPRLGFKKRGYILSPIAARPYVEQRVTRLMDQFHANSWFIDCDGFGDYFDDYSSTHPATQQMDLAARVGRLQWIRDHFDLVIGTEGCSAGVASTVHFAHGVFTPVIGWGDPDLSNPKSKFFEGKYYPANGPKIFFMPAPVKEEYQHVYYDPRFRLPLFQTVFHDSVIATHHWSSSSLKPKGLQATVELLELLYNVPPLYHLNREEFQTRRAKIQHHYQFFSPLHREMAQLPMTDFRWLTPDRSVQLTTFGAHEDMIANFGSGSFNFEGIELAPQSVAVRWHDGKSILYHP